MDELARLANLYDAFEPSDSGAFQRRARILQSMWRVEQGYPIGERGDSGLRRPLGSRLPMPWAKETLANYLTEIIRQVVRAEVLAAPKDGQRKLFSRPRIFDDLLSSQPLCFNLFGELQQDLTLASAVFRDLALGRVAEVTDIAFEHSFGRGDLRYTEDSSAFDVYVEYETPYAGQGFIGIEVKYHEDLGDKAVPLRPRYEEIAARMGCFKAEQLVRLRASPLQQIWRDHLLAGSLRQSDSGFVDGCFAFLHPLDNMDCFNALQDYRDCLLNCDSFEAWTVEDVRAAIRRHTASDWIAHFTDRYLNFDKLLGA
jgi:hypothetical protein